jgi:dTDP-4-dehydrorhamnose reductase
MSRLILGRGKVSEIIKNKDDFVFSRAACDINDKDTLNKIFDTLQPKVIINCAAKTNLEYCQEEKIECFNSNTQGVLNLISLAMERNIKLVHVSSGCLFDGNEIIATEDSLPTPAVWYTWTKTWADQIIKNFGYDNYLILRPRQLISKTSHPTNMITKFSKMSFIPAIDEENSLTCIEDFKEMIDHLLKIDAKGVYNCCNTGTLSPYEIATRIKKTINPNITIKKCSYEDLLKILPNRRVNTILSCEKLITSGFKPRDASLALDWCLKNYEK